MDDTNNSVENGDNTQSIDNQPIKQLPIEIGYAAAKKDIILAINTAGRKYNLSTFILLKLVKELALENENMTLSDSLAKIGDE